jgi:hypothetical protein
MLTKLVVAALLSLASAFAVAQTATTAATSSTQSQAQGGSLIFAPDSTSTVRYAASSAFGPALTSSNDTCMGSSSMGASGMSFGVAVGSTWTDHNCTMLKNARELWNQGEHAASLALLCTDEDIRYSLSVSGGVLDRRSDGAVIRRGCPMSRAEWIAKGQPLLDPATGEPIASGTVALAAPVVLQRPMTTVSVDAKGVVSTSTPLYKSADEIEAHAARLGASAN